MTITVTENETRQSLDQFMKKFTGDCCCLRMLRFFGSHPSSRFNKLAIIHAVDENGSRLRVEKALAQLLDEGVVKMYTENDICLYWLTRDEPLRQMVLDLAEFDWLQWQAILEHKNPK